MRREVGDALLRKADALCIQTIGLHKSGHPTLASVPILKRAAEAWPGLRDTIERRMVLRGTRVHLLTLRTYPIPVLPIPSVPRGVNLEERWLIRYEPDRLVPVPYHIVMFPVHSTHTRVGWRLSLVKQHCGQLLDGIKAMGWTNVTFPAPDTNFPEEDGLARHLLSELLDDRVVLVEPKEEAHAKPAE